MKANPTLFASPTSQTVRSLGVKRMGAPVEQERATDKTGQLEKAKDGAAGTHSLISTLIQNVQVS